MSYEPGRYWGRVSRTELGETKNGHPQVVIRFVVLSMVDPNSPEHTHPCEQTERTIYRVITDKSAEWVANDMRVLGYTKDSWAYLDPDHGSYESLAGTDFEAVCTHETFNDKLQERWNIFNPNAAPPVKPLDKTSIRKLDAMFGKVLKDAKATVSEPVESQPQMATRSEDVPF